MKNRFRLVIAVLLIFSLTVSLSGCGKGDGSRTNKPKFISSKASVDQISVENTNYLLSFDPATSTLNLTDKSTGTMYSSVVSNSEDDFSSQQIITSSLVVDYIQQLDNNYKTLYSSDVEKCKISCEAADKVLKVTYIFDDEKISVPVEYALSDEGLSASVNLNKIAEGSKNMVGRISLLPLFARVTNKSENGYLLIPSGCGGIAYTKDGTPKISSMEVYGSDLCEVQSMLWTSQKVYMPVFGSKQDESAYFGIIESGAEMATLSSNVNDSKLGYSFIYPVFKVRGFNKVIKNTSQSVESFIYNEDIADETIKVNYYLLNGENAGYNGMANRYRKYLDKKYGEQTKSKSSPSLSLKILGGVEEKKFFFGIPYNSLYALTTISEAKEMTKEIKTKTGVDPIVQLAGFGDGGLENKKIAGGYTIASKLGNVNEIVDWQKKSVVAVDFDLVNFSKSSSGFSVNGNAARSTTDDIVEQNYYQVALLSANKALKGYYLLSRYDLDSAGNKLSDFVSKNGIKALSCSTLCNVAYSDYGNRKYFAKAGMGSQVRSIISEFKKNTFISNAAFEYAAGMSDYIMDAPIITSKSKIIDEEIPFYQMVFGSRTAVYNTSVNLETDDNYAILKAAESGAGLEYTINKHYSTKLIGSSQNMLYATNYAGVRDRIISEVKEYKDFYGLICNSYIKQHIVLENGLRKTVFDNGVTVYVNYSDKTLTDGEITVKEKSFLAKEG